jgi:hypothetical protein
VPLLREENSRSGPRAPDHPHYMAVCCVGPRSFGAFKKAPRGLTRLLVAVDKFTKWIESRPLAKIGSKKVVNFI